MPDQPPFTVLCVDDDDDNRLSVALLLMPERYRVLEAATGTEALVLARDADLVILDIRLPDMSGVEVCRRIKADPATSLVPVIFLSGHFTDDEDKAGGLEGGGDVYLTKPTDPRVLLGQVKALFRVRRAELLLREQAEVIEQIHDAVFATDLAGNITRWNRGAKRLFGYTAGEMLSQHIGLLDPPGSDEVGLGQALDAVRTGGNHEGERTVLRKNGEEAHIHSSFSLLRDRRGEASGVICFAIDVSERRRLEERVRQAERLEAVGQLAGGVAHDFNNLMTVVTGYSDILLGGLPDDDPKRGLVEEVKRAGERAASLTQQLLAFSRKQILSAQVLDLNAIVLEAEAVLQRSLGGIELRTALATDLGRIKADAAQIKQVVANFVVNARDAMPRGGRLTIETRNVKLTGSAGPTSEGSPGPHVMLSVTDTGTGMTPEIKARIFEPFFTTKGPGEGTGLGLSAVYGIVRQSGGQVEVDSEPGRGSTFRVYLPIVAMAEPAPLTCSKTVLVMEAEEAIRKLYGLVLRQCGYSVLVASDEADALRIAGEDAGEIHLLVGDLAGADGRDLIDHLRISHPEMKVLFVPAHGGDVMVLQGIAASGDNFLPKPFSASAFAAKVRDILAKPRSSGQ